MSENQPLDPIADHLDGDPIEESRIHRVWKGVDAKLTAVEPPRKSLWPPLAGALTAAAIALVWIGWPRDAGPMELRDGGALVATEAGEETTRLSFSDGSHMSVAPGARIVPTVNTSDAISFTLEGGQARFEVQPNGPRVWRVQTERVEVRVVGTVFTVEQGEAGDRVSVQRGTVEVSERLTGQIRILRGGDQVFFQVFFPTPAAEPNADSTANEAAATTLPAQVANRSAQANRDVPRPERASEEESAVAVVAEDWRRMARDGSLEEAYDAMQASPPSDSSSLLLAVDVARRTGHLDHAVAMLEQILREPRSDETALAAITLGRIERRRSRHQEAIDAFERARQIGVPPGFVDEVCAERALARRQLGDEESARQIAGECLGLNQDSIYAPRLRPLLRAR